MVDISVLIKSASKRSLSLFCVVSQKEYSRGFLPEPEHESAPVSGFQPPELIKMSFYSLKGTQFMPFCFSTLTKLNFCVNQF
jgi:hypothetical protein